MFLHMDSNATLEMPFSPSLVTNSRCKNKQHSSVSGHFSVALLQCSDESEMKCNEKLNYILHYLKFLKSNTVIFHCNIRNIRAMQWMFCSSVHHIVLMISQIKNNTICVLHFTCSSNKIAVLSYTWFSPYKTSRHLGFANLFRGQNILIQLRFTIPKYKNCTPVTTHLK